MSLATETTKLQQWSANPKNSTFVMANAGSGKTRVLTDRVARLLLADVNPQQVLCITFTKAAAAEMADRLFKLLGEWSLADDTSLRATLQNLEGSDARAWAEQDLAAVRCLFARALETPGGLKIQTIHSFCESVLKRFPLEAGAPPGFSVIEDTDARALITETINTLVSGASDGSTFSADLKRLAVQKTETNLRDIWSKQAQSGLKWNALLSRHETIDNALRALAATLDIDASLDADQEKKRFIDGLDRNELRSAADILAHSSKEPKKRAQSIDDFLAATSLNGQWQALGELFLTIDGSPRKDLTTAPIKKAHPALDPFLTAQQEQFVVIADMLRSLAIYQDAAAYYRTIYAIRTAYTEAKEARAVLDFDDLIVMTRRLLESQHHDWIRFRLDYGIDHILIDEAQDTSPDQWRVVEALIDDYLSGSSAREVNRTFFAVGDIKQSIYSFQGADAELFQEKEKLIGKALAAYHHQLGDGEYQKIDLQTSFRTTAPVLKFVDAAFQDKEALSGLGEEPLAHMANRAGEAGLVELWPLTPMPEKPKGNAWDDPVDATPHNHPAEVLSDRIAQKIHRWNRDDEILESQGRKIRPDDIMVLVQSRGRLFDGVLRALAAHGVPVAGADRIKLLEDTAIEDLLSYARFCVQPRDDLSLAEVLKSPLFGFNDDLDLFPLAHGRPENQTLWASLTENADTKPHWKQALEEITAARRIALREGPYAFFTHVLETDPSGENNTGRRRFHRRLSSVVSETLDEFLRQTLDFERANPRSLRLFLRWIRDHAGEIKREMERGANCVRVMTVHAAKGLEANIVFLIDAHKPPNISDLGMPMKMSTRDRQTAGEEELRVFISNQRSDSDETKRARETAKDNAYKEYRRQFYVAATRARDRLFICGIEGGRGKPKNEKPTGEKTWHALAADAFENLEDAARVDEAGFWPDSEEPRWRLTGKQVAPAKSTRKTVVAYETDMPDCLWTAARTEHEPQRIAPSRIAEDEEADDGTTPTFPGGVYSPSDGDRYFRGRTLHRLLELLPDVAPSQREAVATRLLGRLAPDLPEQTVIEWRDEVLTVLSDPSFTDVFHRESRAEVAITGEINGKIVSGQIDRLYIGEKTILLVDYKTNRPPPENVDDTPQAYLAQMAAYRALLQEIYPDHQITCALLWTFAARMHALPKSLLDRAYKQWLSPG